MKVTVSTDEYYPIIETLFAELKQRGHEILYFGPKKGEKPQDWTAVTFKAMKAIKDGDAEEGIALCWTGTGATLIANKMPGIRAALCVDGETAKGARTWNHANVLGLSLRLITPEKLQEILDKWFATPYNEDEWNLKQIQAIEEVENYRFDEPLKK